MPVTHLCVVNPKVNRTQNVLTSRNLHMMDTEMSKILEAVIRALSKRHRLP